MIQNASSRVLELRSEHQDGHTLNVILQPGTQVWLGDTAAPVREIQGQREGERVLELDHTRIESCLAVDEQRCMGWKVSDSGSIQVRTGAPESE